MKKKMRHSCSPSDHHLLPNLAAQMYYLTPAAASACLCDRRRRRCKLTGASAAAMMTGLDHRTAAALFACGGGFTESKASVQS